MDRFIIIIVGFSIFMGVITYLLSKLKNKIYKYVPSIMLFIISIMFFVKAMFFSQTWEDIIFGLLFFITIIASIFSLICALIFKNIKKKNENILRR